MAFVTKPRQSAPHKKRKAGHHRQNKHYHKPYWPYLPVMLFIVGLGVILNSFWTPSKQVLGVQDDFSATRLVNETNERRTDKSLSKLALDAQLNTAAQNKANDMVARNYWSHTTPDSKSFSSFIINSGYQYEVVGENLAYGFGDAEQVVSGWMNSKEHRENILNNEYQNVGFGVASSPNYLGKGPAVVVVAEYGKPAPQAVANITFKVDSPATQAVMGDTSADSTQGVSRIQVLTGGKAIWSLALLSAVVGATLMLFIIRHGFRLHRLFTRSEQFIVKHPWLDVSFVFIITVGFVLTRTGGLIQ